MARLVSCPAPPPRRGLATALLVLFTLAGLPLGVASAAPAFESATTVPLAVTTADTTAVTTTSAKIAGTIRTAVPGAGYIFQWGTTTSYQWRSELTYLATDDRLQRVSAELSNLQPATTYHWRIVAGNPLTQVFGENRTFTTNGDGDGPAPEARRSAPEDENAGGGPKPHLAEDVVASPARGGIRVKQKGAKKYVQLQDASSIPVGSTIDARKGRVKLVSAIDAAGSELQSGTFYGGLFRVRQGADGMIDLALKGGSFKRRCRTARRSRTVARTSRVSRDVGRRVVRRLWGRDHNGRFRTHGRNSVATVRGTVWLVADRCDGTLTKVREGAVSVRDRETGRVIELKAGQKHLARAHR